MRVLAAALLSTLVLTADAGAQARTVQPLPGVWREGLNVTAFWWQDFFGNRGRTWIKRARTNARAEEVTFVVSGFQWFTDPGRKDHLDAVEIHDSPGSTARCRGKDGTDWRTCKTPSLSSLRTAIGRARAAGLRVRLRPQIDVGAGNSTFRMRDEIDKGPGERRAWFDSYARWLSRYARLARDLRLDTFVVGAGLSKMTDEPADRDEWRALIAHLRSGELMGDGAGGFAGEVTYAAQWDSVVQDAMDPAEQLFFWDALDVIAIDAYFPVVPAANGSNPTIGDLRTGWFQANGGLPTSPVDVVRRLHDEYGRDVWFSALGYLSREGTAVFPEKPDWELARDGGRLRMQPQSRAVRAAFDVWAPIAAEGWFRGISWWEWPPTGRGGRGDGSYALPGKPAETEICIRHAGVVTKRCRPSY